MYWTFDGDEDDAILFISRIEELKKILAVCVSLYVALILLHLELDLLPRQDAATFFFRLPILLAPLALVLVSARAPIS